MCPQHEQFRHLGSSEDDDVSISPTGKTPKFEGSQNGIVYFKQFCTDLNFKNAQYTPAPMLSAEWHRGERGALSCLPV